MPKLLNPSLMRFLDDFATRGATFEILVGITLKLTSGKLTIKLPLLKMPDFPQLFAGFA